MPFSHRNTLMKTIMDLRNYISYQLNELKSNNEHHKFEDLCREIAKAKICPNILPSTGPVSAGGDGGRDFENFKAYTDTDTKFFQGKASQKSIVFACTLQKDKIPTKIKNDINLICKSPLAVDDIVYFSVEKIPSKKSLKLREWAQKDKNITLQIFDGKAISEILSAEDVFLVAEQFLSVPRDYYPEKHNKETWYKESIKFWKINTPNLCSYADFFEIKKYLRYAWSQKATLIDLRFWLDKMEFFISDDSIGNLKRSAIYEVIIANLKGLGNISTQIEKLKEYFSEIDKLVTHSELLEASVLLNYCVLQVKSGLQIEHDLLLVWISQITAKVDRELSSSKEPNKRCFFLRIKGLISLTRQVQDETSHFNVNEIFSCWQELIKIAKEARLFPIQEFSDQLNAFVPYLGSFPQFRELCAQVDEIVSARSGENIIAKNCAKRSRAFLENKQVILALKELHNARIKWFSGDTLRESIHAALTIAECFLQLNMTYAAKYYILGVLFIIQNQEDASVKVLLPHCIFALIRVDFKSGSWFNCVSLVETVYEAESMYLNGKDEYFAKALSYFFMVHQCAAKISEDLLKPLDNKLLHLVGGSQEDKNALIKEFSTNSSASKMIANLQSEIVDSPFNDIGIKRTISWKALGIIWHVGFENTLELTPIAEGIVATLQIMVTELVGLDLSLLPTAACLNIVLNPDKIFELSDVPSNEITAWKIEISTKFKTLTLDHIEDYILGLVITILQNCSVHPKKLEETCKNFIKEGFANKAFTIRPYHELWDAVLDQDFLDVETRHSLKPQTPENWNIQEHEELQAFQGNGITYTKEQSLFHIKNRYENTIKPIRLTLKRLVLDEGFNRNIEEFRANKLLDWHVLLVIFNIIANYKTSRQSGLTLDWQKKNDFVLKWREQEQIEDDLSIQPELFSLENLQLHWKNFLPTLLKTMGLEIHSYSPNIVAIERFLEERYNLFVDDVDHEEIFCSVDAGKL